MPLLLQDCGIGILPNLLNIRGGPRYLDPHGHIAFQKRAASGCCA